MSQRHTPRSRANTVIITDETNGSVICTHGRLANTFRTRLFGLLGRKGIPEGGGLLIKPSSGVHTFGMSFPIDIVSLNRNDQVIELFHNIKAWKIRGLSFRTRSVLELPAGRIRECGIEPGDRVKIASSVLPQ